MRFRCFFDSHQPWFVSLDSRVLLDAVTAFCFCARTNNILVFFLLKAALKKFQMEHKSKGESLEKCQGELKKLRRKSQGSKNPSKYGEKELQVSPPLPLPPPLLAAGASASGVFERLWFSETTYVMLMRDDFNSVWMRVVQQGFCDRENATGGREAVGVYTNSTAAYRLWCARRHLGSVF